MAEKSLESDTSEPVTEKPKDPCENTSKGHAETAVQHVISTSCCSDKSPSTATSTGNEANEKSPLPYNETWKDPPINICRLGATYWAFFEKGLHDGAIGALFPYLQMYYHIDYLTVSFIFITPIVGYAINPFLNDPIHARLGQRGIATLGGLSHITCNLIIALHPPFPVVVIAFAIAGIGHAFVDVSWCAWVGALPNNHTALGFLEASYGLGALVSPLIATVMIVKAGYPWYNWFYVMIAASVVELVVGLTSFWSASGAAFRRATNAANLLAPEGQVTGKARLKEVVTGEPARRVSWNTALFVFFLCGLEVAASGWIVSYALAVRKGGPFESGMTSTGFWIGLCVGRMVLGFSTARFGVRVVVSVCLAFMIILWFVIWFAPHFLAAAVPIAFIGFFLGPVFPSAIMVCTTMLPRHLHLSAIGFSQSLGGGGGQMWPFAIGAIALRTGIHVLPPFCIALTTGALVVWLLLPRQATMRERWAEKGMKLMP